MKKLLTLCLLVVSMCAVAQTKKVAVYVTGTDVGINKVLGSKLVSAIARSEEFSAIERTESFLAELSKEQNYQRTGAVDDDELTRLGKQFGVQYICVASVAEAFDEQYLSARLIDVETAQVERTASSSGAIRELQDIVNAANSVCLDLLSNLNQGRLSNSKKVAVYVVKNEAGKQIGRVLGDKLVAGFTNSGRYLAIERTNSFLSQLSKEQNYQRTGAVEDDDISRLGKQFGVQYVCVADVTDVLGAKYISARLIDVETAEVVNTYDVGGNLYSMNECLRMASDIATHLSEGTFEEQAEERRLEAERQEQERLRRIEEERLAEQRRIEAETLAEQKRKQALMNRDWRNLLDTRITTVTSKYSDSWYVGQKYEGQRHGLGLYYWTDGTLYFGRWENGQKNGIGINIVTKGYRINNCPEGMVYVGEWKNSKKQGTGTIYDENGKLIYYGRFFNDKPTEKYPSEGDWSQYTFTIQNLDNGDKYVGECVDSKRKGKGIYIWAEANGSSIVWYGSWGNDTRNGYGIRIYNSGKDMQTGTWKNGNLQ